MGPVWLLLLLLPIAQGAEPCDVRKNNTQCYGALGGTIEIKLMDSGSTTPRCIWKKKGDTLFEWRKQRPTINRQKSDYFDNNTGTFHMHTLSQKDNDSYTVEFFTGEGENNKTITHTLIVEVNVSSVDVEHQCLSEGEMEVNCTAEKGDSPEFSWTLDGQNLTDSQILSKDNKNKSITLKQDTKGLLRCSVKNHVSEGYKEINISTCGYKFINCTLNGTQISGWVSKDNKTCSEPTTTTPTTSAPITSVGKTVLTSSTNQTVQPTSPPWYIRHWPLMAGALGGVLITGMLIVAFTCLVKKKCKKNQEEEHELTYADVRILQQPGRRPQPQPSEGEVVYGQVKFSNQDQHVSEAVDNACIYAKVRG